MPAKAPHKGKTLYLKGMPSQLGGHNIYEDTMKAVQSWLKPPHFCPTNLPALRAEQDA